MGRPVMSAADAVARSLVVVTEAIALLNSRVSKVRVAKHLIIAHDLLRQVTTAPTPAPTPAASAPPSPPVPATSAARRERLPDERSSITRSFKLHKSPRANVCPACKHRWEEQADIQIYAIVGTYPDGRPGELFIHADKVGTTAHGALDGAAMAISLGLQHGVPIHCFTDKLVGMSFGAQGFTTDKKYPRVQSVLDLVGRWLRDTFPEAK